MTSEISWVFPERGRQKWRDPVTEEFFANSDLLTDISSLVRESIQNSLDARKDDSKPVQVFIRVGDNNIAVQGKYFGGLQEHLNACEENGEGFQISNPGRYLVVEDFNTIGLGGDVTLAEVPEGEKTGWGYTFFAHMEGAGNRRSGGLGTWGVGKVVFPKLSKIKSFLAFSIRSAEHSFGGPQKILFGQSILKFHKIDDKTFQPDGWFAQDVAENVYGPVPESMVDPFCEHFELRRKNELGLSIVVPHIPESVSIDQLRDAVIRQYFVAILSGALEVNLSSADSAVILNSTTLKTEVANLTMEGAAALDQTAEQMAKNIEICSAFFGGVTSDIQTYELDIGGNITASSFSLGDEIKANLRKSLENGKVTGLKISMSLSKLEAEGGKPSSATLWILMKDSQGLKVSPTYSRQGILVPGKARTLSDVVPLVLVQSGPLAELLASAEGPAHESWDVKSKGFAKKFGDSAKHESQLVNAVRQLPHWIVNTISSNNGEQDLKALAEWFPNKDGGIGKTTPKPTPPPKPPKTAEPSVQTYPKGSGFVIKNTSTKLKKGTLLKVKVAFGVSTGNPFKAWSNIDFDFTKDFVPMKTNIDVDVIDGNTFKIRILKEEWEFELPSILNLPNLELLKLRDIELDIQFSSDEEES